jgi:decaprenyl-phosphate phosphoribosyltransferase
LVLERTVEAFAIFLIASAGVYLINDAIDAQSDRAHPDKRHRPIASGALSASLAIGTGGTFLVTGLVLAGVVAGWQLATVIGAYIVINAAYMFGLKRLPVVELACVSAGFVLRAIAGGVAVHVPISPWFAIVTSSAALLVVAGKRSAEIDLLGRACTFHRRVLEQYSQPYLRFVRMIAGSVTIVSFCLWAFQRAAHVDGGHGGNDDILFELSILPFVLGILSVELAIESGDGGVPEELVLKNRTIQVLGLSCLVFVALGIYT